MGVVIKPEFRRCGIGQRITEERLIRISENSKEAYFIVNSHNKASIELHEKLGFKKIEEGEGFLKLNLMVEKAISLNGLAQNSLTSQKRDRSYKSGKDLSIRDDTKSGLPKVILLGGAPLSGKSEVACLLSRRLGFDLLHTDDFGTAIRAMDHSLQVDGLDPMVGGDYKEYYLQGEVKNLMQEALTAHRALWPAVQAVILARADWGEPAIVEGWALLPEVVAEGLPANCKAVWLVVDDRVFEQRLRSQPTFYKGARDETKLIKQFAARSVAFNQYLQAQTSQYGLPTIRLCPSDLPEATADQILALLK